MSISTDRIAMLVPTVAKRAERQGHGDVVEKLTY